MGIYVDGSFYRIHLRELPNMEMGERRENIRKKSEEIQTLGIRRHSNDLTIQIIRGPG